MVALLLGAALNADAFDGPDASVAAYLAHWGAGPAGRTRDIEGARSRILLRPGAAIEDISKLLGHADVWVTQQAYAELLDETVARRTLAVIGRVA
jgi:integrase